MGGVFNPPAAGTYRLKKAINANPTTAAANGMDGLIAFVTAASPGGGSPAALALAAAPDIPGGDFDTLVLLPWLMAASSAGGLGLGVAAASALIAALRSATPNLSI